MSLLKQDIDETTKYNIIDYIEKNESLKMILHPARLSIIQVMNQNNTILRSELKEILMMNSGTLQRHLDALKDAGFIEEELSFVDDKPRKMMFITQQGRMEYTSFKHHMKNVIDTI